MQATGTLVCLLPDHVFGMPHRRVGVLEHRFIVPVEIPPC